MSSSASAMQDRMKGLFADLLGIRFIEVTADRVVATSLNLPPGAGTTTIESKTNFLAAARTGSTVSAQCVPLHRGKQTMVWQTRVSSDGKLLATVTQTQMVLSAKQTPQEILTALFAEKPVAEQKLLLAS